MSDIEILEHSSQLFDHFFVQTQTTYQCDDLPTVKELFGFVFENVLAHFLKIRRFQIESLLPEKIEDFLCLKMVLILVPATGELVELGSIFSNSLAS